mmetsp:Transcript_10446/g.33179  ORF Transcript_10446/g.33179 Transcript_10446/m.33179 type:complete len:209 (+) Transcript_10446:2055-2681(+)
MRSLGVVLCAGGSGGEGCECTGVRGGASDGGWPGPGVRGWRRGTGTCGAGATGDAGRSEAAESGRWVERDTEWSRVRCSESRAYACVVRGRVSVGQRGGGAVRRVPGVVRGGVVRASGAMAERVGGGGARRKRHAVSSTVGGVAVAGVWQVPRGDEQHGGAMCWGWEWRVSLRCHTVARCDSDRGECMATRGEQRLVAGDQWHWSGCW